MKKTLLLIITLAFTVLVAAGDNVPATILAMHKPDEKIECNFTETKVMPKMKKTTQRTGKMVFQAPEDLRMDFDEPAGDYTLIKKDVFEVCKNGKVQHFNVKNPEHRMGTYRATLLYCLAGQVEKAAKLNEAQTQYKTTGDKYICTLTTDKAKTSAREISSLVLEYNKKTGRLTSMTLTEGNGNYTTYSVH